MPEHRGHFDGGVAGIIQLAFLVGRLADLIVKLCTSQLCETMHIMSSPIAICQLLLSRIAAADAHLPRVVNDTRSDPLLNCG